MNSFSAEAKIMSKKLVTCHLTHYAAHMPQTCSIKSKLFYPLIASSLSDKQLNSIQDLIHPTVISSKGFNKYWPVALRYRIYEYSGLGMMDMRVKQRVRKI